MANFIGGYIVSGTRKTLAEETGRNRLLTGHLSTINFRRLHLANDDNQLRGKGSYFIVDSFFNDAFPCNLGVLLSASYPEEFVDHSSVFLLVLLTQY